MIQGLGVLASDGFRTSELLHNPQSPCAQYLGTWGFGNWNSSTGFGLSM